MLVSRAVVTSAWVFYLLEGLLASAERGDGSRPPAREHQLLQSRVTRGSATPTASAIDARLLGDPWAGSWTTGAQLQLAPLGVAQPPWIDARLLDTAPPADLAGAYRWQGQAWAGAAQVPQLVGQRSRTDDMMPPVMPASWLQTVTGNSVSNAQHDFVGNAEQDKRVAELEESVQTLRNEVREERKVAAVARDMAANMTSAFAALKAEDALIQKGLEAKVAVAAAEASDARLAAAKERAEAQKELGAARDWLEELTRLQLGERYPPPRLAGSGQSQEADSSEDAVRAEIERVVESALPSKSPTSKPLPPAFALQ
eukprot:TRINITY_DN9046_c0_g1_i3.p1 TRINITY_DN9046_c0_g1~~TRINITY_DN9046_c0_g1_i3.p1  ORF type:complete len:314 (-),score=62.16 TRINITY_DN9046_c0_g1_i3:50-991(-)